MAKLKNIKNVKLTEFLQNCNVVLYSEYGIQIVSDYGRVWLVPNKTQKGTIEFSIQQADFPGDDFWEVQSETKPYVKEY